jgi:hypothetical protein
MHRRKNSLVILICLFLISFKVAAGNIFVDAALERAQMHQASVASLVSDQNHHAKESTDGEQQSHTLFLMSHVTANISGMDIILFTPPVFQFIFAATSEELFTQNFPDSAFKPPKS